MIDQSPHDEPSNMQRALWAKAALAVFTSETYGGDHPDSMDSGDLEDSITDLICDLLHFARFHPRLDAAAIHAHALRIFEQEVAEEANSDCKDRSWYGPNHDTQRPVHSKADIASTQTKGSKSAKPVPYWLDTLLDIKRLAEKSGDHEADPFALLDLIAYAALKAIHHTIQE